MLRKLLLLLLVTSACAQVTPYLGLNLPPYASPNWNGPINANFSALDNYLTGNTALPLNLLLNGYFDDKEIATPANPGAGFERWYANISTHQFTCLTSSGGNCAPGAGGSVGGSGTAGYFPIWTAGTTLANSVLTNVTGPPAGLNYSLSGGLSWQIDAQHVTFNSGCGGSCSVVIANTYAAGNNNQAGGVTIQAAPATGSACAGPVILNGGSTNGSGLTNVGSITVGGACSNGFGAAGADITIQPVSVSASNGGGNINLYPGLGASGNGVVRTNGAMVIAPTVTATALSVTGDAAGSTLLNLSANAGHATPGYAEFLQETDGSLLLDMYDNATTGLATFGPTGASLYGAVMTVNPGSIKTGVALTTTGDSAGSDVQDWANQSGIVGKLTHSGAFIPYGPIATPSVPTVASATTIAPTAQITHISGTVTISTITIPFSGFEGCLQFIPTGLWTTTTGGNIALGSTAVVSRVLTECYDGTSWYPSY